MRRFQWLLLVFVLHAFAATPAFAEDAGFLRTEQLRYQNANVLLRAVADVPESLQNTGQLLFALAIWVITIALLLAGATDVSVETLDGKTVAGSLVALDQQSVTLEADAVTKPSLDARTS